MKKIIGLSAIAGIVILFASCSTPVTTSVIPSMSGSDVTAMPVMMTQGNNIMMESIPLMMGNKMMDSKIMPMVMNGNPVMINGKMLQVQMSNGHMMMLNGKMTPMMMGCSMMPVSGNITMNCSIIVVNDSMMTKNMVSSDAMPMMINNQTIMNNNNVLQVQMDNGKMITMLNGKTIPVIMNCSATPMKVNGKMMPMVMNCNIMPMMTAK